MKFETAKQEFIQTWGSLGSAWGIPKSMAQIHALLLSSDKPLCTEDIMEAVQMSRGNVSINLRELINWRLVTKQNILGERKEYYFAQHDVWTMARNIAEERMRRELQPALGFLRSMKSEVITGGTEVEIRHFKQLIEDLEEMVTQLDHMGEIMLKVQNNMMFKKLIKMMS